MSFAEAAAAAWGLAAQALGWTPDTFWNATPAELRGALGLGAETDERLGRDGLARLMEAFPDG